MPEAVLEFKAKDGAWYAGTATFKGPFLHVHFEHFPDDEDELWLPARFKTPSDVKKMIRPASQPMQDSQCSSLLPGIFLCVACRHPGSDCFEYYDAKLQEIYRSPHTIDPEGQDCCGCKFEVEWLGGSLQHQRRLVTCEDICLKTHGDIEDDAVIKDFLAAVKGGKVLKRNEAEKVVSSSPRKWKPLSMLNERGEQANCELSASIMDYKSLDPSILCDESSNQIKDTVIKDNLADEKVLKSKDAFKKDALKKRKGTSISDGKREQANPANCEQSASQSAYKGVSTSLQGGVSSNQNRNCCTKKEEHNEEQPLKKICLNTQGSNCSGPPAVSHNLQDSNCSLKEHVDIIQIDSDQEEDCKPSFRVNLTQTDAINAVSEIKLAEDDHCSKSDNKYVPQNASPSLDDGFSTRHDFSGISKEQMFSSMGDVAASSCAPLPRHCFKGESCQYEAVGFIPIAPFHLTNMCTHSKYSHVNFKSSCKQTRSGYTYPHSATCQYCSQNAHFQADITGHMQDCEGSADTKETPRANKANSREYFCESEKGLDHTQFLLVQNIEKDVIPAKALKVIRKVTCGALMVYIWPSLDYETSRKGYICYEDPEAAEAAYQKLRAENLFIVSLQGRPWVVSRAHLHKLDWFQMYSISAAIVRKEEDTNNGKEAEGGDLFLLYKGTEEYTRARGKHKLFLEQQKELRLRFQQFNCEEKELEILS